MSQEQASMNLAVTPASLDLLIEGLGYLASSRAAYLYLNLINGREQMKQGTALPSPEGQIPITEDVEVSSPV